MSDGAVSPAEAAPAPPLVRIRNLVFDREVTLLNCVDLELGEDRQFRLDRISAATVVEPGELPSA